MSVYPQRAELPLFAPRVDAYPNRAGAKTVGTSQAAADSITPTLKRNQRLVLEALRKFGPHTPDELAELMGRTPFYTRPRFTELKLLGLIYETGETRPNASGKAADVCAAKGGGPE